MTRLFYAAQAWLYASWIATVLDIVFVAKTTVTYQELLDFDPDIAQELTSCSLCTVIRTAVIVSTVYSILWWLL